MRSGSAAGRRAPYPARGARQDIVTAHEHFNMDDFVQQFQESLKVTAPRKRAFLLSWMQARRRGPGPALPQPCPSIQARAATASAHGRGASRAALARAAPPRAAGRRQERSRSAVPQESAGAGERALEPLIPVRSYAGPV